MIRLTSCVLLATSLSAAAAQETPPHDRVSAGPVVMKLPAPIYPPIALAARVSGSVELKLMLRPDGTVDSEEVVSGPAMLKQAALGLVSRTVFECKGCTETVTPFQVVFKFELGEAIFCEGRDQSYPRISQSANTVTVTDRPFGTCDPSATIDKIRVRSVKCLFLWRCGWCDVKP
jgi:TonB family protein